MRVLEEMKQARTHEAGDYADHAQIADDLLRRHEDLDPLSVLSLDAASGWADSASLVKSSKLPSGDPYRNDKRQSDHESECGQR